ncbi:hypothetical protein ANCDUO_09132 [Ancylostoma duodenale]|uniref:Uncharacterized protein n=1 Tax=Ancylostoma duodenale TaxID=51022 RepID=A0A0C2GTW3_9BILA|nr:hypothetical protein ANCDUO_09132 [Ancylostoma duodenale]
MSQFKSVRRTSKRLASPADLLQLLLVSDLAMKQLHLRQQSKFRDAAAYAKLGKIRWAGHMMRLNDNRWTKAVSDLTPRNVKRTTGRPPTDGQTSSRSPSKNDILLFVSLERTKSIRLLWHVRLTNERARSAHPKIKGRKED